MALQDKLAVIIVVFNISHLIEKQIDLVQKFCQDEYDIIVVDNSSNLDNARTVESIVRRRGCQYKKTSSIADFSQSHASACNQGYKVYRDIYKYMLFLDHDNFPVKYFSIKKVMENKIMGGVGQSRGTINYYWPGCVMINNQLIDTQMVDFSTNPKLSLDTGGNLYRVVEKYGFDNCVNFDQYDIQNPADQSYSFYNLICNPKTMPHEFAFMHFINASNWNNKERNEERIVSLLAILNDKIKDL